VISGDGAYRYVLNRRWNGTDPVLCWIMLNPSTADADTDDPTIYRCSYRARTWGYGGICVLNLFALRAASPAELWTHPDPVGPENDQWLAGARDGSDIAVAWGVNGTLRGRDREVLDLLAGGPGRLLCLGRTRGGYPRHPLYVPYDQGLVPLAG